MKLYLLGADHSLLPLLQPIYPSCTTAWALLQVQYCPVTTLCTTELTSFTDMEVLWRRKALHCTVDSLIGYYSVYRRYQSPGGILKRLLSMNHEMSCGTESTMLGDKCNTYLTPELSSICDPCKPLTLQTAWPGQRPSCPELTSQTQLGNIIHIRNI